MGDLLTDHESARPCSAVMLGPQPNPVNSLIFRGLQRVEEAADRLHSREAEDALDPEGVAVSVPDMCVPDNSPIANVRSNRFKVSTLERTPLIPTLAPYVLTVRCLPSRGRFAQYYDEASRNSGAHPRAEADFHEGCSTNTKPLALTWARPA
jgi:hypothetical protein